MRQSAFHKGRLGAGENLKKIGNQQLRVGEGIAQGATSSNPEIINPKILSP